MVRNYAGLVACRVFIGFPEVIFHFLFFVETKVDGLSKNIQAAFYPGTIYLLSRLVIYKLYAIVVLLTKIFKLVHKKGTSNTIYHPVKLTCRCSWQELALRSCILYGGFIISNAFGSVRFKV